MIFEFSDPEVREAYLDLWYKLDGTQPCAEDPDAWVENWTGRTIPASIAKEKCEPCKFQEECLLYAMLAGEETGIWGGTTPEMRKEMREQE